MSTQGTIRRYTLIVEKLTSHQSPSFQVLKEYLNDHGFEISPRTLQRDIEQIRYEFGIEIKYNRARNGYYIDTEESIHLDSFLRFLEIAGTANLIAESLKDGKETLSYISFEAQGYLKGIENLKSLLFAIRNHRKITFTHENFETGKLRKYSVKPYLLKEYQNRWYVVGLLPGTSESRTFGIDRLQDLKITSQPFVPDPGFDPVGLFEHTVGLVYSNVEVEDVILSFTPLQAKYARSLPLHKSQQVIRETKKEVVMKLRVRPNYEFKQKILMLGDQVKVLEPEWLVKEMKDIVNRIIRRYD